MKEKKIITITLISIFLIIVFFLAYNYVRGYGEVSISVYPPDSIYNIRGKEYSGNQSLKLRSGKYEVIFRRNLFDDKKEIINIIKNKKIEIEVLLEPGQEIYDLQKQLTGKDAEYVDISEQLKYQESNEAFLKENPIIKDLPIIKKYYRIDYSLDDVGDAVIEITLFEEYLTENNKSKIKEEATKEVSKYKVNIGSIVWYRAFRDKISERRPL